MNGRNLQITHLETMKRKENDMNQTSLIMFHVNLQGCNCNPNCLLQLQLCQLCANEASPLDQRIPQINIQGVTWIYLDGVQVGHPITASCLFQSHFPVPISKPCGLNVCLRKLTFCKIRSEKQIVACLLLRFAQICTIEVVVRYLPQGFVSFTAFVFFPQPVLTLRNISVGAATTKSFAQLLTLAQSAGSIILHLSVHANDLDGLPIVVIETSNHHLPTNTK